MHFPMIKFAQIRKKQYLCMLFRGARMRKYYARERDEQLTNKIINQN